MGSSRKTSITVRHQLFAEAYVANKMNATEAARRAGYNGTPAVLSALASKLLKNQLVRAYIDANLKQEGIVPAEVIGLLARHMRGEMTDFLTTEGEVLLDLQRARNGKRLGLVKKFKQKQHSYFDPKGGEHTETTIELELYSSQGAADLLGKALGLYREKDDDAADGSGPSDEQLLTLFQRFQVPKAMWPPGVLRFYESQTKPVKSKEASK